ncbi:MAG: hypothetical protein ACYT04_81010 [Nostoc sp.]
MLYYNIIPRLESDRRLYLAIRQGTYSELFQIYHVNRNN